MSFLVVLLLVVVISFLEFLCTISVLSLYYRRSKTTEVEYSMLINQENNLIHQKMTAKEFVKLSQTIDKVRRNYGIIHSVLEDSSFHKAQLLYRILPVRFYTATNQLGLPSVSILLILFINGFTHLLFIPYLPFATTTCVFLFYFGVIIGLERYQRQGKLYMVQIFRIISFLLCLIFFLWIELPIVKQNI